MQARSFKDCPTVALTATATDKVRQDILRSLHITSCTHFQARSLLQHSQYCVAMDRCSPLSGSLHSGFGALQVSFYRENLKFKVVPKVKGTDDEGRPLALEALLGYIR